MNREAHNVNTPIHLYDEPDVQLLQRHPQLTDKALIDWINGLEVVDDHLRVRSKEKSFLGRVFDFATGATERRQQHIDQNLHAGLSAAFSGLQDLQRHAARSDLAVEIIADKLTQTRAGVMRMNVKFTEQFDAVWQQMDAIVANYGPRLASLELRTARLERLDWVDAHIELVLSKWSAGHYQSFSPLERLFVACNELQWGDFGDFQRQLSKQAMPDLRGERMLETVHNKLTAQMRRDCGDSNLPRPMAAWLEVQQHRALQENHALIGCLAADYPNVAMCPLPAVLADRSSSVLQSLALPRSAGPAKLVQHMLAETVLTREFLC